MSLQARTGRTPSQPSPKVYSSDNSPNYWIAEATDGCLYRVPNEPGGWVQCSAMSCDRYVGQPHELTPLSPEEARSVMWFVYGDVGAVRIAEG